MANLECEVNTKANRRATSMVLNAEGTLIAKNPPGA